MVYHTCKLSTTPHRIT